MEYDKIDNMHQRTYILDVFAHVLDIFAVFPYPTMGRTTAGRRPRAAGPLLWRRPEAVCIMGDGKTANMFKTCAITYNIYPCLRRLPILSHSIYVAPGAIHLAESADPDF